MQNNAPSSMLKTDLKRQRAQYFHPPHWVMADVWMFAAFSNVYALRTSAGLLLIDAGLRGFGAQVQQTLRTWTADPIHTLILTHGHMDHAGGLTSFQNADDPPQNIVAQENVLHRFERYRLTNGWNGHINMIQFGLPQPIFPRHFVLPTRTFHNQLALTVGELDIEIYAARGETDDMCYVWLPEQRYLFCGDLFEWTLPNTGNPQKVSRFPLEWAEAAEKMAALQPEVLFPGHGFVLQGKEVIQTLLSDVAALNQDLVMQVVERMNKGETPEAIYHAVEPRAELMEKWYLQPTYDDPKFVVRNILQRYGGWWNGRFADLLPSPVQTQAQAIAELAGGTTAIIAKGRIYLETGNLALAAHHADWATQADPANLDAQAFKRDVYEARIDAEPSLMAKGIFRHAANEARELLGKKPLPPHTPLSLG